MSDIPSGPGARPNRSVSAFQDREGRVSDAAVFTDVPRLTGVDQGSSTLSRVETYTSCRPWAPGYGWLEDRTISRPSLRTFGWMSLPGLFSSTMGEAGPKLPSA